MNGQVDAGTGAAPLLDVLIVEDDPDIAETLALILEDRGYRTETAGNGREALERLRRAPRPAVILLDLTMPVMDGRDFRRLQRETPELAEIPVVVVTADAGADPRSGMDAPDWLVKPVALDALVETVARYCGVRQAD